MINVKKIVKNSKKRDAGNGFVAIREHIFLSHLEARNARHEKLYNLHTFVDIIEFQKQFETILRNVIIMKLLIKGHSIFKLIRELIFVPTNLNTFGNVGNTQPPAHVSRCYLR